MDDMTDFDTEPWFVTVVRAHGLKQIKPEKTWRPIVTVEIDKLYCYELALGIDGQNPNLKERFAFPDADMSARVEIKVWHEPPSKKKKKKRQLVASAMQTLGELVKRQEVEPRIEVQLQCLTQNKKAAASRGRQQNASLHLQLQPPPQLSLRDRSGSGSGYGSDSHISSTAVSHPPSIGSEDTDEEEHGHSDGDEDEDDETAPLLPHIPHPDSQSQGLRRRRKRKPRPYFIFSEDERNYQSESESESDSSSSSTCLDITKSPSSPFTPVEGPEGIYLSLPLTNSVLGWIAPSLLPRYTEHIAVPVKQEGGVGGWIRRAVEGFTLYGDLRAADSANSESEFEGVFRRVLMEWSYIGGLLVAIAAVDTAVFAISPDAVFSVDTSYARTAIAASSIASGLGIACDAWFLVRYGWVDVPCFIARAKDVFDSYFFFALSARVPALCMLAASTSLMLFLGIVAYEVFPTGVLILSFLVGLTMTLQFLVYGVHWAGTRVVRGARAVRRVVVRAGGGGGGGGREGGAGAREVGGAGA